MERYEKVARTHRALSWIYAAILILFLGLALMPGSTRPPPALFAVAAVFGGLFAIHYFTAKAAWQKKPGGRTASIVISIFMLAGFPVGTLIALYLLLNTARPWDEETRSSESLPRLPREAPKL